MLYLHCCCEIGVHVTDGEMFPYHVIHGMGGFKTVDGI
jgi:hypothetical protein